VLEFAKSSALCKTKELL